jgi:hypothetical protein
MECSLPAFLTSDCIQTGTGDEEQQCMRGRRISIADNHTTGSGKDSDEVELLL